MPSKAAQKALDKFLAQADRSYGAGKFQRALEPKPYEVISTGSIELDAALVVGGYVKGRIVEVWGNEGVGKTTLAIIACAQAQRQDPDRSVLWIDVEHRFDAKWARDHGLDLERLVFVKPDNAEEVADMVKDASRSEAFSIIVVDSIGAMIGEKEKEKDAGEATVGIQAKIVTRMVKLNAVEADKTGTVVFLINQVRAAIGAYGQDTTTGGGWALKHATTMKLHLRRTSNGAVYTGTGDKRQQVGHSITVKVERSSVALAYRKAEFVLLYVPTHQYGPMGIDRASEAASVGIRMGIIEQSGAWYTLPNGERINGRDKVLQYLREHHDVIADIRVRAIEQLAHEVVYDGGVNEDGTVNAIDSGGFTVGVED